MLGWKGLVLGIPKMYHMLCRTCVDLFRLDFELGVVGWPQQELSKALGLTITITITNPINEREI